MSLIEKRNRLSYIAFFKSSITEETRKMISENAILTAEKDETFNIYKSLDCFIDDMCTPKSKDEDTENYFDNLDDIELWECVYPDDTLYHVEHPYMVGVDNVILLKRIDDMSYIKNRISLEKLIKSEPEGLLQSIKRKVLIFKHILLL